MPSLFLSKLRANRDWEKDCDRVRVRDEIIIRLHEGEYGKQGLGRDVYVCRYVLYRLECVGVGWIRVRVKVRTETGTEKRHT
jgi:hypothetical protein